MNELLSKIRGIPQIKGHLIVLIPTLCPSPQGHWQSEEEGNPRIFGETVSVTDIRVSLSLNHFLSTHMLYFAG